MLLMLRKGAIMTVYAGAPVPLGGFVTRRSFCFTGWHSAAMAGSVLAVFSGGGWAAGAGIGFISGMLVPDPEPITKTVIVAALTSGAAKVGLGVGAAAGILVVAMAQCAPCGSCYCVYYYTAPGTGVPIPLMILPCTGSCGMIPPGCP